MQMAQFNAKQLREAAEEARKRGNLVASRHLNRAAKVKGATRAALAAQGIDVGSGSAERAQDEIGALSEIDASEIRMNAYREAFGYRSKALNEIYEARVQQRADRAKAKSILTSATASAIGQVGTALYKYDQEQFLKKEADAKFISENVPETLGGDPGPVYYDYDKNLKFDENDPALYGIPNYGGGSFF
jgi:hypothetical protein